ncbi:UDP-2,4-diacetamido-2,4,6-trideoxy-beta-L-altropyranose hydrolase [Vibrio fortis]|uniref:UDP-2,4-diacetamido-2,4, 6-trideoxy-beta-L-altropyranose hydrolase n=1 Tax=Vibrio fortis TaxID=212667 RepID=UPI0021C3BDBC|nr:UDP-2,4-diacetamido-2,4,6-trideoxy-beta-L-altropyranose hydrolase [Vibrio fortis]
MNIIIRVDASTHIGSGHVMRCLVLAKALKEKKHSVSFVCRTQLGDMIGFIQDQEFDVVSLGYVTPEVEPTHSADYLAWLQCSVEKDAKDFLSKISDADIVITDHYAIGKEWQSIIRNTLNCRIMAIDDLAREHDADLVLDQTLGREKDAYANIEHVLTGTKYALLNSYFPALREQACKRITPQGDVKILVSMGGIDAPNATLAVLAQLSTLENIEVTVLLSPRSPHYISVKSYCQTKPNIKHIDFVSNMAHEMVNHDISIGAPGTTSWERACLGLPSIIIPLADNQVDNCVALVKASAVKLVDFNSIGSNLVPSYQELIDDYEVYVKCNLDICDGLGVMRVVNEIEKNHQSSITLRSAAIEDIDITYQWQSTPLVRKYFKHPEVPTRNEHRKWMLKVIKNIYIDLFIIQNDGVDVGSVRVDKNKSLNNGEISILIAPEFHGLNFAKRALIEVKKKYSSYTLTAFVHIDNQPSQHLFESSGFTRLDENNFVWYSNE